MSDDKKYQDDENKLLDQLITCQSCKGHYGQSPESCCTDCMNTGVDNDPSSVLLHKYLTLYKSEHASLTALQRNYSDLAVILTNCQAALKDFKYSLRVERTTTNRLEDTLFEVNKLITLKNEALALEKGKVSRLEAQLDDSLSVVKQKNDLILDEREKTVIAVGHLEFIAKQSRKMNGGLVNVIGKYADKALEELKGGEG